MLKLFLGAAGTGKTTRLSGEIEAVARRGEKVILLVPEQYSFESEKRLHRALGPRDSLQVEVLSFTRLCDNIFRRFGGLAGTPVTQTARYLLMSVAVNELQDTLKVYRKSASNITFLDTLLATCSEFKTAGITPEALSAFHAEAEDERLRDKLEDLTAIYGAYQALLENGFSDPEDGLIRACTLLENNNYFGDFHLFVDGFTTFMSAEFELLGHAIAQSPAVTFAMTTDSLPVPGEDTGVFATVRGAVGRLMRMAEQAAVSVEEPIFLREPVRYQSKDLAHLSGHFLEAGGEPFSGRAEHIRLRPGRDIYAETAQTAAEIATLVREKGYRYRDIAVIARDHTSYLSAVETIFLRYGIPFYDDRKEAADSFPLISGLLAAIDAVRGNFDGEGMLYLAKSPIIGFGVEEVARLEDYCYIWSIRGALWESDFVNNPRGLVEGVTEGDAALLQELNGLRVRLVEPLLGLREAVRDGNGMGFARGVYEYLQRIGAVDNLGCYAEKLPQLEGETFLEQNALLWDALIDVLDVFGLVLGRVSMKRARLCELFQLAVSTAEVGSIPQTLDQVLVGSADRIRPERVKAVFVLGCNEGIFPPNVGVGGVFSDRERQQLVEGGLNLSPPGFQQSLLERFYAYFALGLPEEELTVSWARADLRGREMLPSLIVSQLEALFPDRAEPEQDILEGAAGDRSAFALLAERYREDSPLTATLLDYFEHSERRDALLRMEAAGSNSAHELADPALPRQLFGGRMRLSPSRVERYYKCPFSYFAQDGLGLRKRRKVEFSPLESGNVIHHVLHVVVQKYGGAGLADRTLEQLQEEVAGVIEAYLSGRVEDLSKMPVRFRHLFGRLCGTIARLLQRLGEEFQQSLYCPAAFELPISSREEDGVEPLELVTPDGVPVTVEGIVDRVDVMKKNGKRYLRVVDYKSGSKAFKLQDVLYGLNLQMLLYLFTLQEHGTGELADAIPAGVLYLPVSDSYVAASRDTTAEDVGKEKSRQWTMSGLLLDDEDSLQGMEQELRGIYIPCKAGKDGTPDARSSLATREELGRLAAKVKEQIVRMADDLGKGKIASFPVDSDDYPTCAYCDYRSVCGYEEGDPVREIAKIDRKAVLEQLEKEQNQD